MKMGGASASMMPGMKATATFDENGTVTLHIDFDLSAMSLAFGPGGKPAGTPAKPSMIHLTMTGTYQVIKDTMTLRLYEQQAHADDPKLQRMESLGKGMSVKQMSKPTTSRIVWKSADEFSMNLQSTPTTFTRIKGGLF